MGNSGKRGLWEIMEGCFGVFFFLACRWALTDILSCIAIIYSMLYQLFNEWYGNGSGICIYIFSTILNMQFTLQATITELCNVLMVTTRAETTNR